MQLINNVNILNNLNTKNVSIDITKVKHTDSWLSVYFINLAHQSTKNTHTINHTATLFPY